jgi:hypothetical protein
MAVPSFVGVAEGRNGTPEGAGSLTLSVPAGSSGDLLVAVVGVKVNPSTTTPAGWIKIIAGFNGCTSTSAPQEGIRAQLSTWWKIADGSETSATFSFGAGVTRQASGAILRYSGADPSSPIDASACGSGTSAAPAAPSVTTTSADDRILRMVVSDADDAKSLFTSEPATKRFEIESTTVFGAGSSYTSEAVITAGSDEAQAAAGATGTAAWALPSADQWAAQTVAIKPSAGGGGEDQEGCVAAIIAVIRRILEGIINAIKNLFNKGSASVKERRARRKAEPYS